MSASLDKRSAGDKSSAGQQRRRCSMALAVDSLLDFGQPYSFSLHVFRIARFRDADRSCEKYLCKIVAIETGNIAVTGDCQRILRLNNFDVVGDSRRESIARLFQVLSGQRYRALFDSN